MRVPKELFRDALYENHAGIILLDAQQRVVFWNRWMSNHSGFDDHQVLGKTLAEIYPETDLGRLKKGIVQAIEHGQSSILSYSLNRTPLPLTLDPHQADAKRVEQTTVIKRLHQEGGERYGFVKIVDVTAAVARETLLQERSEQLRQLAERHRDGEAMARAVIENIRDALVTVDNAGNIIDLNRAAHALFGYSDEAILGKPLRSLLVGVDDQFTGPIDFANTEVECVTAHGGVFAAELKASDIEGDERGRRIIVIRDLTERKRFEDAIFEEKEFAQVTLQALKEAVITTDARGVINGCNEAATSLLGSQKSLVIGRALSELLVFEKTTHRHMVRVALTEALEQGVNTELEGDPELVARNGVSVKIAGCVAALRGQENRIIGSVAVLQDVSAERHMQAVLSYQASHDELTELINRREFERRLESLVHRNDRKSQSILLFLDLDQFKLINDACGHYAGDKLLRQLTGIMQMQVRQADTFARLGGDEFAVLLPGCDQAVGQRIAESLRDAVRQFRFQWANSYYGVGVSIGLVVIDDHWHSVVDLMSAADSACYIAKESGRDQVVVYQPAGDKEQRRRGEISQAARIRESLERNRFRLFCQPIVPLSGRIENNWGIEILVRMVDEEGHLIPPGVFIPAAERYDLMSYIDRWVVEAVCRHWQARPEDFRDLDKIAINLSGLSIANEEFLQFLIQRIGASALPWNKVCLEITETAAVNSIEKAQHLIAELSGRGCRFALDDFGSGLSSFAYLKNLPVDYLKIDGTFVRDMLNDPMDSAMVHSISSIGRSLGLKTIAEFVEDTAIMAALREADVDFAQGYGICRPMPLDELAGWSPTEVEDRAYDQTA